MATQLFANNATGALASGISNSATSLTLTTGQGALFPTPSGGDWFLLTLTQATGPESSWEIVKCTARSGDTLTVVRGQESIAATAWGVGAKVELRVTAGTLLGKFLSEIIQDKASVSGAVSVDLAKGRVVTATVTGAVTWSFSGLIPSETNSVTLVLTNPGVGIQTFPVGTTFDRNATPILPSAGKTALMLETYDGGSSWIATQIWRNVA